MYGDALVFRVLIFIFFFGTNGKKGHLDENDFCQCYRQCFRISYSESYLITTILKVPSQQL